MSKLSYKEQVTQNVINELGDDNIHTFEQAIKTWWMVPRRDSGLRLTNVGDLSFRLAKMEYFNFDFMFKEPMSWNSFILALNKKIMCPYYIAVNKNEGGVKTPFIRLYDSKIAMLVGLYGSLYEYLESIKER